MNSYGSFKLITLKLILDEISLHKKFIHNELRCGVLSIFITICRTNLICTLFFLITKRRWYETQLGNVEC